MRRFALLLGLVWTIAEMWTRSSRPHWQFVGWAVANALSWPNLDKRAPEGGIFQRRHWKILLDMFCMNSCFYKAFFSGFSLKYGSCFNDICCRLRNVVSPLFVSSSFCIKGRSLKIYLQSCIKLCNLVIAAEMQDFFLEKLSKKQWKALKNLFRNWQLMLFLLETFPQASGMMGQWIFCLASIDYILLTQLLPFLWSAY